MCHCRVLGNLQPSFIEPQLDSETTGIFVNSCLLWDQVSVHKSFHEIKQDGLF